jgi:hypothetical protein
LRIRIYRERYFFLSEVGYNLRCDYLYTDICVACVGLRAIALMRLPLNCSLFEGWYLTDLWD